MLAQAVNTNNLANASTVGFRADLLRAQSAYLEGTGVDSRVHIRPQFTAVDFDHGTVNTTGRDLDVAVNGEGWIGVLAEDGTRALSRRGDLRVGPGGQLLDGAGLQVLGEGGPIALPPYSELSIGTDGTISIVAPGESPDSATPVDRLALYNPPLNQLEKDPDGSLRMKDGQALPPVDGAVRLIPGAIESSNVDSVGAMVHMISLARQFESHIKFMKVAEQLDAASAELMSVS